MNKTVRVLLADDHRVVRAALRALLQSEPGVQVVGEAEDGRSAVRLAAELSPDVVVMDITMPDLNGIDATRQIRKGEGHAPKVIGLSCHSAGAYVTEMIQAGASGFVVKEEAFGELAEAIRTALADGVYLSPTVIIQDVALRRQDESSSDAPRLSPREREVLQLLAEGKATKEVAYHLSISVKTAETHRRNLMEKIGVQSLAELTKYAVREGITPP